MAVSQFATPEQTKAYPNPITLTSLVILTSICHRYDREVYISPVPGEPLSLSPSRLSHCSPRSVFDSLFAPAVGGRETNFSISHNYCEWLRLLTVDWQRKGAQSPMDCQKGIKFQLAARSPFLQIRVSSDVRRGTRKMRRPGTMPKPQAAKRCCKKKDDRGTLRYIIGSPKIVAVGWSLNSPH